MLQLHTCLSVHCDQCADALGAPRFQLHYRTDKAALAAATGQGWRTGPGQRLLCSACAPVLDCETEGHQFSIWRHPVTATGQPGPSQYRHCWHCCRHESRPATGHDGDEPR